MAEIKIKVKGLEPKTFPEGTTLKEIVKALHPKNGNKYLAGKINGKLCDLNTPLTSDAEIEFISPEEEEGLKIMRHSAAHIMALAVKTLFPDVKLGIGPAIDTGFYYDFDTKHTFTPEDLIKIEKTMQQIIKQNIAFERRELSKAEAKEFFTQAGEVYKVELIEDIPDAKVSLYTSGALVDLCAGPHLPSSGKLGVFKLLNLAGAYWRGSEDRPMLQRIYGTVFNTKEELDKFLFAREEAARRDHRRLGKELELYGIYDEGGPGLIYWHPKGARVRRIIEDFWLKEHFKRGYEVVNTPHIARLDLWKTSGHLSFYRENMYSPIDIEGQEYILKPMNCPMHILIYKSHKHSYRDLPLRMAELGTVYRYERSGVLHGMLRVRGFTQDDAHIFCTPEQLKSEMLDCVALAQYLMEVFGFKEYEVNLATRPEDFAGTPQEWDQAESTLAEALRERGIPYQMDPGGAVFYGPKIDIKIKDSLGRLWQGPTIQFDFNLARRFEVNYVGADGKEHQCFMVHRAVRGSLERFMGCLIEHYGGAFPVWLAPIQVRVMSLTDKQIDYAKEVQRKLQELEFRVDADLQPGKVNLKISEAQREKIPYMLVIGEREQQEGTVAVRHRKEGNLWAMKLEDFIVRLKDEVEQRI
jgi:threonyl-tRNA synthetase